jgi:hypothetical protein
VATVVIDLGGAAGVLFVYVGTFDVGGVVAFALGC